MRNIMKFGAHDNREFGVVVIRPPAIPTPVERGESIEIPGRNGSVWKGEGAYSPITMTVNLWIPPEASLTQVRGWLTGEGKLRFDEGAPYWDARISGETHFIPCVLNDGWTATVTFECQPFRRIDSEKIVIRSNPQTVHNPYSAYSEPRISVRCTGDFTLTVGGSTCIVQGVTGEVVLDSEAQECYQGNVLLNHHMSGMFGVLAAGDTVIAYEGAVTGMEIEPNWRTL